jgi:soluble lytic murein transglycosylase
LNGPPEKAYRWALGEAERTGAALSGAERAAAAGRLAAARSSYGEALRLFRIVLEEEPGLFTRYPDLTADLGRTFQFAGAGEEGLTRFLAWEEGLEDAEEPGPLPYLLLYYAGRMARSLGRHTQGTALFTQALAAAPDQVQKDACIWYILSGTLISRPGNAAARFKEYLPHWYDDRYFADLLDQLSRYLTAQRQWKTLGELFSLIRFKNDGASTARFAWILGRAVEEGYLSPAEGASILGKGGIDRGETARAFFTLAFEESSTSFYYRVLSASRLGNLGGLVVAAGSSANETLPPKPPLALPPGGLLPENAPSGHEAEAVKTPGAGLGIFLGGFFSYGAGAFAASYLEEIMDDLSLSELREAAEVFAKAGEWRESIRLAAACMARPDYELSRRDLELNYPRPYRELIEENAAAASLAPAILYGLVRTESNFTPEILSRAGAVGLTQLMDATAREMAGRIARQGGPDYLSAGELDLTGPAVNLHIGAYYLNYLIGRMGSPLLALLAYNGGMGRVRRWRAAEPSLPEDLFLETIEYPETRDYGRRVLAAAAAYGYLYYGMSMEALIADIFKGTPKK